MQFISFPFALLFGRLGDRIGTKRAIYLGLAVFVGVTFYAYFMHTEWQFYVLAAVFGTVQGGVQALSRSYFARLIPRERAGEYFGFYNMLAKFAAVLGPLVMGVVAIATGNQRLSILVLAVFFVVGACCCRACPRAEALLARTAWRRTAARRDRTAAVPRHRTWAVAQLRVLARQRPQRARQLRLFRGDTLAIGDRPFVRCAGRSRRSARSSRTPASAQGLRAFRARAAPTPGDQRQPQRAARRQQHHQRFVVAILSPSRPSSPSWRSMLKLTNSSCHQALTACQACTVAGIQGESSTA